MKPRLLFALVAVAAAARLLLQLAAMAPYAGLDEVWHVSRLAFVRAAGRQPTSAEKSIPHYLGKSIRGEPDSMPSFGEARAKWPEIVTARHGDVAVPQRIEMQPFESPNYEAQQPSLYYAVAAPLGGSDALHELQRWRLLAALLALIVVLATAVFAYRQFGPKGLLAAALITSLPTWLTLVLRAGNDSLACALVAAGIAIGAAGGPVIAEALVWAAAVATKLYTWPIAIVVPLLARRNWRRVAIVAAACAVAALITIHDTKTRTFNPLGAYGLNPPTAHAQPKPIDYLGMVKVTIAGFLWTSGQHADALTSPAMALYALPILIAVALTARGGYVKITAAAVAAFAIAQAVNAAGWIRLAKAEGLSLPQGGKEGWYWYALAPLFAGVLLTLALKRWRWITFWIVAWDIAINEGALFHDWAGTASPAHPGLFTRWGPPHLPFTAHLDGIGVGPLAGHLIALRAVHLGALFALESLLHDRHAHR